LATLKCSDVRAFLTQLDRHDEHGTITPIPSADIDYLSVNGYVLKTTKDDYVKAVQDVGRLSEMTAQMNAERAEEQQAAATLVKDESKEHSFVLHFEGKIANDQKIAQLAQR
jgi:hypothetical protein